MMSASKEAPRLWLVSMSLDVGEEMLRLSSQVRPPRVVVENLVELSQRLRDHVGVCLNDEPMRLPMASPPTVRIRISESGFAPDHLNPGVTLLSRKAREALRLGPQDVQYLDVDASSSTQEAIARDYRAVLPLKTADPLDRSRSDGDWREVHRLDGQVERLWRLRTPDPEAGSLRLVWQNDFTAPGPLFVALGPGWLLATDDLASRAKSHSLTGLAFIDLENDGTRTQIAFK